MVVKRTAMEKRLQFFFTMFSTSAKYQSILFTCTVNVLLSFCYEFKPVFFKNFKILINAPVYPTKKVKSIKKVHGVNYMYL